MRRGGFKAGNIAGIEIDIDWSWLLIFILVSWNLTAGFAELHPSWGGPLTLVLAFIGWFLHTAATQSYQEVALHDVLAGVPVKRLMRAGQLSTVSAGTSVTTLVNDNTLGTDERAFPVLEGDRLVGLVCLDDVRKVARSAWEATRVGQIMTPLDRLALAYPEEEAGEAFAALADRDVDQLPVVDSGRLVGLFRRRDHLRWLQLQEGGALD